MYRIFILEDKVPVMLSEGPFSTHEEAVRFGKSEVGPPFFVAEVFVDDPKQDEVFKTHEDECGWMRFYYNGQFVCDTPVSITKNGTWSQDDGGYGLHEHLNGLDVDSPVSISLTIESEAMKVFMRDRTAMFQMLGYVVVYIPGRDPS